MCIATNKLLVKGTKHVLYAMGDFTKEEIARNNILAVLVRDHRLICKQCGALDGFELAFPCGRKGIKEMKRMSRRYKWVLVFHNSAVFLTEKPKRVNGGFMDRHGVRWIYRDISLHKRHMSDMLV